MAEKIAAEKVTVCVLLPKSLADTVSQIAAKEGETVSSTVRHLIRAGLHLRVEQSE